MEENMATSRDNCNVFHGFSEEEIRAAFENSSWAERNGLISNLVGREQNPSLGFATLRCSSSFVGGLACWPQNWPSCGLELVRGGICPPPPPPASCDCSVELGQVGSYLPPLRLQSPVATKRATVPCRHSNPVSDKINPGRTRDPPSTDQQVKWKGG